jgi:hypothetical protein
MRPCIPKKKYLHAAAVSLSSLPATFRNGSRFVEPRDPKENRKTLAPNRVIHIIPSSS